MPEYERCTCAKAWGEKLAELGWWHSYELPDGTRIQGVNSLQSQKERIGRFPIAQDLQGKRVLDIGAWDGWFSVEMERRGAEVVAIDPWDSPNFRLIREMTHSRIDYRQMDLFDLSPDQIGRFDIVIFMGVLYHVKHPVLALERVAAVTKDLAAIDTFIIKKTSDPASELQQPPLMEYYETIELGGQVDNWVGLNLSCLMAMCRTAGFPRVEVCGLSEYGASVAGYRRWTEPTAGSAPAPQLVALQHTQTRGINFQRLRDEYIECVFTAARKEMDRLTVMPEVGGLASSAIHVKPYGEGVWHATFRLPVGLDPGWHDIRLRLSDTEWSNSIRIAVDVSPEFSGALSIGGVRDAATYADGQLDLARGRALSLWIRGLPANADRFNVKADAGGRAAEVTFVEAGEGELRQVNVMVTGEPDDEQAALSVTCFGRQSEPRTIRILRS